MNALKIFIEIYLSIHILLFISSWVVSGNWLLGKPSIKLKLARLLFASCILSPIAIHCISQTEKLPMTNFVSLDSLQTYVNQPVLKPLSTTTDSIPLSKLSTINYWQLFFGLFCTVFLFRGHRFIRNLKKLVLILHTAVPYRSHGRLVIKISDRCHIPFSIYVFNNAYIILPVSLLDSSQNLKIALAHEGQHHRNGDCLWVYMIEMVRAAFFCNPGVTRWSHILSELQELACDETLIKYQMIDVKDYGNCLFKVAQTAAQYSNQERFSCAVGMALNGKRENKFIIQRITLLKNYQLKTSRRLILSTILATSAIIAPLCTAYAAAGTLTDNTNKAIDSAFINPRIQRIATNEITAAVKQYQAKSGVIAVADPKTGKIIAFAQAGEVSGNNNWASRLFAPGSTIKPFVAATAIDTGTSSPAKIYNCHSPYFVNGVKFDNYDKNVNSITLADAIAQSNNICLIKVAQAIDPAIFRKKLTDFGFDMNGALQASKNTDLQLATAAIGESVPSTISTLIKAYAILANKGHLFASNTSIVSEKTANSVTSMLEKVVNNGTGNTAAIPGIAIAGKTGTVMNDASNVRLALFSGYAPANAPRYVITVIIENGYTYKSGEKTANGGSLAAPVFHNVLVKSLSD